MDEEVLEGERKYDYQRWYHYAPGHYQSKVLMLSMDELEVLNPFIQPFSEVDVTVSELLPIQQRINQVAEEGIPALPWFVRLTSRSPKDSSDCKAQSAKDVLKLLCESGRVKEDVENYMEDKAEIGIVIQPWRTNISIENELRLFFYHKALVALCPIDEEMYAPLSTEEIDLLVDHFSKQPIHFKNYIIDVCFVRQTQEVVFIELNPYGSLSDAMCFDWEADKELLFPTRPSRPIFRTENPHSK